LADVQEVAQEHSVAAIKTLASIMAKAKAPAAGRIAAASALLDRGYGKPLQAVHAETQTQLRCIRSTHDGRGMDCRVRD
jgi:hypothetical protein